MSVLVDQVVWVGWLCAGERVAVPPASLDPLCVPCLYSDFVYFKAAGGDGDGL